MESHWIKDDIKIKRQKDIDCVANQYPTYAIFPALLVSYYTLPLIIKKFSFFLTVFPFNWCHYWAPSRAVIPLIIIFMSHNNLTDYLLPLWFQKVAHAYWTPQTMRTHNKDRKCVTEHHTVTLAHFSSSSSTVHVTVLCGIEMYIKKMRVQRDI